MRHINLFFLLFLGFTFFGQSFDSLLVGKWMLFKHSYPTKYDNNGFLSGDTNVVHHNFPIFREYTVDGKFNRYQGDFLQEGSYKVITKRRYSYVKYKIEDSYLGTDYFNVNALKNDLMVGQYENLDLLYRFNEDPNDFACYRSHPLSVSIYIKIPDTVNTKSFSSEQFLLQKAKQAFEQKSLYASVFLDLISYLNKDLLEDEEIKKWITHYEKDPLKKLGYLNKMIAQDSLNAWAFSERAKLIHGLLSNESRFLNRNENQNNTLDSLYEVSKNYNVLKDFNKAIKLDSLNSNFYYNRAMYHSSIDALFAKKDLEVAFKLDTTNVIHFETLAWNYYNENKDKMCQFITSYETLIHKDSELFFLRKKECDFREE